MISHLPSLTWPTTTGVLLALALLLAAVPVAAQAVQGDDFLVPSREAFLRQLDLTKPQLAAVKTDLDRGDVAAAGKAYIAWFRQRTFNPDLLTDWATRPRDKSYNTRVADAALAGHLNDGYSVYDVPPTGLDWHNAPLSCVTRFPILPPFRYALHNTGDLKYLHFMVSHIKGYMHAYPITEFVGKNSLDGWVNHTTVAKPWYWCMIPERLQEWPEDLAELRLYPQVSDEDLLAMLQRLYQETGYLTTQVKQWVDRRHNGGCAMIEALAKSCTILDDFPAAHRWLAYDAQMELQYLNTAFYPDGMCVELTTAYSAGVSAMTQKMAYALRSEKAIRAARPRLEALVTCQMALGDPTGRLPSFGDLYAGQVSRAVYLPLADWLGMDWVRARLKGQPQPKPPFTTWPVPGQEQWCGYYTMRSGWDPQARYLAIDGGPWGTTHQHGDRLSFVLTAYGRRFVIDPSSTRYASNEPDSFISRQISGFLHNTITVDGVDEFMGDIPKETKKPLQNTWRQGDHFALFAADYSFAPVKPVQWQRRVVFVNQSYWLLQDVLTGRQSRARVEQNFQFEADIKIEFRGDMTIATAPGGARLVLQPLSGGLQPELTIGDKTPHISYWPDGKPKKVLCREDGRDQMHGRGWTGRGGTRLLPAPAVTYVGEAALPATITVAMIPLAPGQELSRLPAIKHETQGAATVWQLPYAGGELQAQSDLEKLVVETQ